MGENEEVTESTTADASKMEPGPILLIMGLGALFIGFLMDNAVCSTVGVSIAIVGIVLFLTN